MARLLREQDKLKTGAQQTGFRESQRTKQFGVGPQHKKMHQAFPRTTQVGVAETAP